MPQEHQVLRCFSCETFQVHIVKKTKKWECKLCGEKQSLKRNYGKGSGKDCRNQVMKLNELRVLGSNSAELMIVNDESEETLTEECRQQELEKEKPFKSKWAEYLEENIPNGGSEEEDSAVCLSEIVFKKKKRVKNLYKGSPNNGKKICRDFKASVEPFSDICDELKPSFSFDESCNIIDKKTPCETKTQKSNYKKHSAATIGALKHSKYAKYLDDNDENNDTTSPVNKTSNIFNSDLADLDKILDF